MRATGRRRIDLAILVLGAVAVGGVAAIGAVASDTERVTGMWVGASLDDAGGASIVEVIDYDFGLAQGKHGIFRTIPGLTTDSPVTVSSTSAPAGIAGKDPELIDGEPGIRLKIGDPATTVTGRHRYEIDYSLPALAAGGALAWDAVGTGWTVSVGQSEVHVVAPWRFDALQCSSGAAGRSGGCTLTQPEPGHLVVTTDELARGHGVTISARRGPPLDRAPRLPRPPVDAPPDPGTGVLLPAGAATIAGLAAAVATSRAVRRRGRERVGAGGVADAAWAGIDATDTLVDARELDAMATTEFAPPEGISAAQGGVVVAEAVRPEHKVAWLIEAAIAGSVDLEEDGGRAVRLTRPPGAATLPAPLETAFGDRSEIQLGRYDPQFAAGWSAVGAELEAWERSSGLWDASADRRRTITRGLGGLATVVGLAGAAGGGALAARVGASGLALVVLAAVIGGAGLAAAVRGWELRVRTPQGSGLYLRMESFRRFLAGSEAHHAEEAAARGVLREYTAWAVAVGEVDRWARAVAASSAIPQQAGLGYVHMAPMLISTTSSTATAPSSSGGGGGGSVGGGGGGGGGGSW
jgi:hypothetical protein